MPVGRETLARDLNRLIDCIRRNTSLWNLGTHLSNINKMQAYLAEKYMSGPKADAILAKVAPQKKKKRKAAASSAVSMIVDVDGGWGNEKKGDNEDLDEAIIEKDRSFKKRRTGETSNGEGSGWATIRDGIKEEPLADDENPQVVGDVGDEEAPATFTGGLMTSAQLQKALPKKVRQQRETEEEREAALLAQETIYRDTSGRKIDTKAERAEAARRKREREELEARKMEWGKGLVQREEEERRRTQLEKERKRDLAVYADDKELNEELKMKERWNDPAATFLTVCSLWLDLVIVLFNYFSEKNFERPSKTRIYWSPPSSKSLWHKAWIQVGWSW